MEELKELYRNETNVRMSLRYNVIILWLQGYKRKNIAEITHIAYITVNEYINKYKAEGIKGLTMGKSSGASKKLTEQQETQLIECISNKTWLI